MRVSGSCDFLQLSLRDGGQVKQEAADERENEAEQHALPAEPRGHVIRSVSQNESLKGHVYLSKNITVITH